MVRKVRIDNPEDSDLYHKGAKIIIGALFNNEDVPHEELIQWVETNFEFHRFVCARNAIEEYESAIEGPDLLLCDIDFTEPQCGELPTSGVRILLKVKERFPYSVVAYFTGQEQNPSVRETLESKLRFLPSECRIVRGEMPSVSEDLRRKLPALLRQVTRSYLDRASWREKEELWAVLAEGEGSLESVINIVDNQWVLKDLFIGHRIHSEQVALDDWTVETKWRFLSPSELIIAIKNEISRYCGLMYSFSKCFGRWGMKEITHGNSAKTQSQGYYYCDSRLADCIEQQLLELSDTITATWGGDAFDKSIQEIIEEYDKVKELCVLEKTKNYSESLRTIRNRSFQFKGPEIMEYLTRLCPNLEVVSFDVLELEEFEINLPIHRVFEEAFRQLLNPKSKAIEKAEILAGSIRILEHSIPEAAYPSVLFDNYLLISHERLVGDREFNSLASPPDYILSFHNKHISNYGRYYLIKHEGGFKYHDVSSAPIKIVNREIVFGVEPHCLERIPQQSDRFGTHHLFVFTSWRQ